MHHFKTTFSQIKSNGRANLDNSLVRLDPIIHDGVLRVNGRLKGVELDFDKTNPIILPKRDHTTKIIMSDYHVYKCQHSGGPDQLLAEFNCKFWAIDAISLAKKVSNECTLCKIHDPKKITQQAHRIRFGPPLIGRGSTKTIVRKLFCGARCPNKMSDRLTLAEDRSVHRTLFML